MRKLADAEGTMGGVIGQALLMDPREPVYNEDGTYNKFIGGHDGIFGWANPVLKLKEILNEYTVDNLITNAYIELSFLNHFRFKSSANARLVYTKRKRFIPSTVGAMNNPPPGVASLLEQIGRQKNILGNVQLTYNNDFGAHHLNILLGYAVQQETVKSVSGTGEEFSNNLIPFLGAASRADASSNKYGWSMMAYFARVNYSYKDKYLFTGTFRREGSSRFGSNNKYGNFPALSVGWRITNESFMPKISWLNNLKLRAGWGKTGNNNIGNYSSLAFLSQSNYIINSNFVNGYILNSFANKNLGWETSKQINIGLDLTAFSNRLTFSANLYRSITTDMLLPVPLPAISGFTSSLDNVGKVRNKGLELALGYRQQIGSVYLWGNFNISFSRNKVLALKSKNEELWYGSLYATYNVSKVGSPIGMLYGFKVLGIFQNQEEIKKSPKQPGAIPGSFIYYDASGDGVIQYDKTDMVPIGNPWPKYTWGLTLGSSYKNFDITILLTGAHDYDVFSRAQSSTMNMDGVFNVLTAAKYRWRPNDSGKGYWPTTNFWKWERESNSRYVYDASHIWIKNITIGYTMPKSKALNFKIRFYLNANNLYLFTDYPGNNPEINMRGGIHPGFDDTAYPVSRTISLGINLKF